MENRIFIFKNNRPVISKRVKNCSPVYLFAERGRVFYLGRENEVGI